MDQQDWIVRAAQPFAVWQNGFTPEELDTIAAYGETRRQEKGVIERKGQMEAADPIRVTRLAWIANNPDTSWIYDRLWRIGYHLNLKTWRFDLTGISETLQYTIYETDEGGHYDWHTDTIVTAPMPRKLSLSLQLSDPADYDGCVLEVRANNSVDAAPVERGAVIAFPSYVLHRVTPVARGRRASLVSWISGPLFR
ncbi:MAG TPA: 2OG-Fe(II) oxygenase [Rhizomicrobium sp.]|nr:2OG-Fe(II) oxygenase [Rhizomicrobium sp.]